MIDKMIDELTTRLCVEGIKYTKVNGMPRIAINFKDTPYTLCYVEHRPYSAWLDIIIPWPFNKCGGLFSEHYRFVGDLVTRAKVVSNDIDGLKPGLSLLSDPDNKYNNLYEKYSTKFNGIDMLRKYLNAAGIYTYEPTSFNPEFMIDVFTMNGGNKRVVCRLSYYDDLYHVVSFVKGHADAQFSFPEFAIKRVRALLDFCKTDEKEENKMYKVEDIATNYRSIDNVSTINIKATKDGSTGRADLEALRKAVEGVQYVEFKSKAYDAKLIGTGVTWCCGFVDRYTGTDRIIKDVIFDGPATIVFWYDGSKTVVKAQNGEKFDPEKGLAMAISKKFLGNEYSYYEFFKKYVGRYQKKSKKKGKKNEK